jgi:hypothetical protein
MLHLFTNKEKLPKKELEKCHRKIGMLGNGVLPWKRKTGMAVSRC